MNRAAAFIIAATLAAPAMAGSYTAKPVAPASSAKIIGKDINWSCTADGCRGATEASRPLVLCQDLAKRAGRLESFVANGTPLSSDQLDKCNASAKRGAPAELANAK